MARYDYEGLSRDDLQTVIERMEARIAQQDACIAQQDARIALQDARIKYLEDPLDQATRGGKRRAAPFSKGAPEADPQKPGRKPGEPHGRLGHREPPATPPDEVIDMPLPPSYPDCGGAVRSEGVVHQHQIEIPSRPIHHRFDIHVGCCRGCGRRVQPRRPSQTSDAIGAAACQLGARRPDHRGPDEESLRSVLRRHRRTVQRRLRHSAHPRRRGPRGPAGGGAE